MTPDDFEFPDDLEEYLADHNVMNVSTSGDDGPWAAAVFFAHHHRRFYFMSDPNTRHGKHIGATGAMAASVHEDYSAWQEIKGIQMRGTAWQIKEEQNWKSGMRVYFRKFSFAEDFFQKDVPGAISERMKSVRLFCFEPSEITWLDNAAGFGNRVPVYPVQED